MFTETVIFLVFGFWLFFVDVYLGKKTSVEIILKMRMFLIIKQTQPKLTNPVKIIKQRHGYHREVISY
jgi:hypothetical protein